MSKEYTSITYENNIFYCTKNKTKWISVDGKKWYGEEKQIKDLERENRLLGERCNQLLKDKGELANKIADIKANCDLAIEGRDIKIKELELELTVEKDQHQEEINLHLHAEDYIKSLEEEISVLLSCKNCPENKGGWICAKEYENKCLAQKIQHIKELEEENAELKHNKKTVAHLADCLEEKMKERIEELEKENAELKEINSETLTQLNLDNGELIIENEKLRKENAELKAEIENDRDLPTVAYMQGAENQKKKDEKQLIKAKDLIENIIRVTWCEGWNYSLDWKVKAEQFLKEIEKWHN